MNYTSKTLPLNMGETTDPEEVIFICDRMLQKLGRWLRIAGFSVLIPDIEGDKTLSDLARVENGILLTRDRDLAKMKGARSMLFKDDSLKGQLRELKEELPKLCRKGRVSRCPLCNGHLLAADLQMLRDLDVMDQVPEKVRDRQRDFYICRECRKVYWKGKHWENIGKVLSEIGLEPRLPE